MPLSKGGIHKMGFKEENFGLDLQSSLKGKAGVQPSGPGRMETV